MSAGGTSGARPGLADAVLRETEEKYVTSYENAAGRLAALSDWIDNSEENRERDPEALTWSRVAKIAEEVGEAVTALIGVTGQNPRKGFTHAMGDVREELLDVAVTALCAVEHLDRHADTREQSLLSLYRKIEDIWQRAGRP